MIYTGEAEITQKDISLTRDFFSGTPCAVDVHVQVITERNSNDIINQYILFSQIITEQIRLHGRTSKAVVETFRICRDKNVLKEFLRKHEKEVANIMIQFYSQREAMEDYGRSMKREGRDEHARQTAARMYKRGMSLDEVADILDVDVQQVQSWLGFAIVK